MLRNLKKIKITSKIGLPDVLVLLFGVIVVIAIGINLYQNISDTRASNYLEKAFALYQNGKLQESKAYYMKALNRFEDDNHKAFIYSELGDIHFFLKDSQSALVWYKKSYDLNPSNPEVCSNLGLVLGRKGRNNEAIKYLNEAKKLNSNIPQVYNNLGVQFAHQEKIPEAIANFKKAIETDPKFYRAYTNLSAMYFKLDDYENTQKYIDLALKEGADNDPYFTKLLQQQLAGLNKKLE